MVDATNVALHFIEEDVDGEHHATEIELYEDGSLDKWPPGFFDEWEKALKDIMR